MLQSIRLRPALLRLPATRLFSTSSPSSYNSGAKYSFASPAAPAAPSPFSQITPTKPLPFVINRTHSQNIAVYHRKRSGGTNLTTEIKKVEGNARVLAEMIASELGLETDINKVTNHVIIKGLHKKAIDEWLAKKGF